jgi:anthranilate phosphoribosyltransferase
VSSYALDPADFGVERQRGKDLTGGSATENAWITREVLQGRPGPRRDVVCMNAAVALMAAGRAKTPREGFAQALESVQSGAAMQKLDELIAWTHRS